MNEYSDMNMKQDIMLTLSRPTGMSEGKQKVNTRDKY